MSTVILEKRLEPVRRRRQNVGLWQRLALTWAGAALVAVVVLVLQQLLGYSSPVIPVALGLAAVVAACVVAGRHLSRPPTSREIAVVLEERHPDLRGLLLTAVQQKPITGTGLGYLQRRVLHDAVEHSRSHDWSAAIPPERLGLAHVLHLAALALLIAALWQLRAPGSSDRSSLVARIAGISVIPGDTEIERGSSLIILARFGGTPPATADLVVGTAPAERRIKLTRSLSDPVFGGTVQDVTNPFTYRVEYARHETRDYQVKVFEHPRLERADADLRYPGYTAQPPKRVEDTRRVTAVEGTHLDLALHLNKPVTSATLVARDETMPDLPLVPATNAATVALKDFPLAVKATYDLQLVDADGRTNKVPSQFIFEVLPNRTPELKITSPRGDQRPSPLEELAFAGTVWDDFGMPAYGLGFNLVGQETRFAELGTGVPASEKRPFQHLLPLESLGVQEQDLISWFLWADDVGPDGQVRRTTGDLFFGEIRPFDEIFRESSGTQGEQQEGEQGGGEGSPTTRLAELQKQIVNATWKLKRTYTNASVAYAKDASVVHDSQAEAHRRAEELSENARDPRASTLWKQVLSEMDAAVQRLADAESSTTHLSNALAAEQAAYQALLKLQARETEVARSSRGGRGGGGGGRNQQQLDQLDLAEAENRYETQRQAQSPQSAERREQLQVLNRLQELARRQEDVNEQLKELQTALQEARTDAEREDIRRRLKRLQEEQQQMLADMDELQQRMQRPENQSRMAEQRQRLDQAREDMQRANEAARDGSVSQALASGTRAERQLQELRDQVRQETSSEFAEELRDMRADARELSRRQQELSRDIANVERPQRRTLGEPGGNEALAQRVSEQKERFTNLVDRATQLSQAAEESEPLVSRQLYDTLRDLNHTEAQTVTQLQNDLVRDGLMTRSLYERLQETSQNDQAKALELTAEMLRQGYSSQATQAGERAQTGIDRLRRGVEKAADNVLGDDTEALRLAQSELQSLTDQLEREMTQADGNSGNRTDPSDGSDQGRASQQGETPQPGEASQQGQASQEGQGSQLAQASPQSQSGQAGQQGQQGQQGQAGEQGQQGQGQEGQSGQAGGQLAQSQQGRDQGGSGGGGGAQRRPALDLNQLLNPANDGGGTGGSGPILGESYAPWSDRLREVEEMIEFPDLRNDVATARERARLVRQEYRRERKKPDWAVVRLEVVSRLVEVRNRIQEELARRGSEGERVPIDRDPVPGRYSDLVRHYYEELGKDR